MELAKRIRDVRLELGLNQSQLAATVGVSTSISSQWESGAFAPRKAMLERISRAVPDRHKLISSNMSGPCVGSQR
jgi:transcriptional regulator with XRE-family HTH domain